MNKLKITLFALSAALLLTGCADKGSLGRSSLSDQSGGSEEVSENTADPIQDYCVYANALTGEVRVKFIQMSDYGYKYD